MARDCVGGESDFIHIDIGVGGGGGFLLLLLLLERFLGSWVSRGLVLSVIMVMERMSCMYAYIYSFSHPCMYCTKQHDYNEGLIFSSSSLRIIPSISYASYNRWHLPCRSCAIKVRRRR